MSCLWQLNHMLLCCQIVSVISDVTISILLLHTMTSMLGLTFVYSMVDVIMWLSKPVMLNVLPTSFLTCAACLSVYRRWKQRSVMAALPQPTQTQLMSLHDNDSSCPICFDTMMTSLDVSQALVATPCRHVFHRGCLSQWVVIEPTCPKCRNKL